MWLQELSNAEVPAHMLGEISQEKFSELIEQFSARRKISVPEFEVRDRAVGSMC